VLHIAAKFTLGAPLVPLASYQGSCELLVMLVPPVRDVDPSREPHVTLFERVLDEFLEGGT
jgi:hypothetical protein